jgi:hypothetical protein
VSWLIKKLADKLKKVLWQHLLMASRKIHEHPFLVDPTGRFDADRMFLFTIWHQHTDAGL